MEFDPILTSITTSVDTRENRICDADVTVAYSEIPDLVGLVETYFAEYGIGSTGSVLVECSNSVTGAVLLIALLRNQIPFALVPPVVVSEDLKPTPHFCQYRISIGETRWDAGAFSPARAFHLEANPHYNGRTVEPGRLYLRTSGSMGASKLVVHTHKKLLGNARNVVRKYGFGPKSRVAIPVPVAHMYGFGAAFLPAIVSGCSIDLQEKTNLLKYLDRERRFQPTLAFATPAICEMLLKGYKSPRTNYEVLVTSGQRIGEEMFRRLDPLLNGRLINQYGSTEMGAAAACDPSDPLDLRATTIGRPMEGVELRSDAEGVLHCKHPYNFEGYADENGDWLQKAAEDGWYRTGDMVRTQTDGSVVVVGRADASVNRRGYLVLLSDVERMMERLDALSQVVVVAGKTEGKQGQRIGAFCVPRPGNNLNGAQVRQKCFELLPHYAIPDEVSVAESLPLLPSGKVDRQTLAALVG